MFNLINNTILQILTFFYQFLGGNLGLAIIALTLFIRSILIPVTIPSLRSAKKMQELKPLLDKLKKKHKGDKKKIQQAQMELYKKNNINPAAGCLPQIAQIIVLISLYRVLMDFIGQDVVNGLTLNLKFLWLDLSQPDPLYILPVLAGLFQLVFSIAMQSGLKSEVKAPKQKKERKKEEDNIEMAQTMQKQMLYTMPLMTTIIALKFPSGLALYWTISTIFSLVQQLIVSGPGGLIPLLNKFKK
ncbi:YidC/Oxa1 family membrane protein insertase [Patescibacteria group bacterium]|nr:YidC/Oxa1 family membrane protein insertase [Patescibacteria group bacterium]